MMNDYQLEVITTLNCGEIVFSKDGDNTRLKNAIGTLCFTLIDKAIGRLYSWHNENKNSLKRSSCFLTGEAGQL